MSGKTININSNNRLLSPPIESTSSSSINNNNQNNNNLNLIKQNKRLSRVTPSEFDRILADTTITKKYKIVDEENLGKILNLDEIVVNNSPEKLILSGGSSNGNGGTSFSRKSSGTASRIASTSTSSTPNTTTRRKSSDKRNSSSSIRNTITRRVTPIQDSTFTHTNPSDSEDFEVDDGEGGGGRVETVMLGKRSLETPRRSNSSQQSVVGTIKPSESSSHNPTLPRTPDRTTSITGTGTRRETTPKLSRTVSGSRRPSQDGFTIPLRPPTSSSNSNNSSPGIGTIVPTRNNNKAQSEISFDTVSSYVHVPTRTTNPVASGSSSSNFLNEGVGNVNSVKSNQDDKQSSFTNTMRKTSRFFKKLGGGLSSPPTKNQSLSGYSSESNIPLGSPSSSPSTTVKLSLPPPPPVPPIPENFSRIFNSSSSASPAIPSTPPRNRKLSSSSSKKVTSQPLLAQSSPSSNLNSSPNKFRTAYPPGHSRRRSLSLSSLNSFNATVRERERSGSAIALGDDILYKELQKWKNDIDGVLGKIGDGSELRLNVRQEKEEEDEEEVIPAVASVRTGFFNSFPSSNNNNSSISIGGSKNQTGSRANRTSSAPTTPILLEGLPEFIPLQMSFPTSSPQKSKAKVLIRPGSLPTIGSNSTTVGGGEGEGEGGIAFPIPPSLPRKSSLDSSVARLGSAFTTGTTSDNLPTTPPAIKRSSVPSDILIAPYSSSTVSLGAAGGLETITESNPNSPEINLKTPTRLNSSTSNYSNSNNNTTPTRTSLNEGLKQEEEEKDNYSPGGTIVLLPNSKKTRISVVDYFPTTTSSTSTTTTPPTTTNSPLPSLPTSSSYTVDQIRKRINSTTPTKFDSSSASTSALGLGLGLGISSSSSNVKEVKGIEGYKELGIEERARLFARKLWDEDEEFLERRKVAEWLGLSKEINKKTLKYYIDYFDFTNLRLDMAFRKLCQKLYLKAETQQVDRIIECFSSRYYINNPSTIYGTKDIVYAVSYSLLLLNTDLHVVQGNSNKMKSSQFVKNTLMAIRAQKEVEDQVLEKFCAGRDSLETNGNGSMLFGGGNTSTNHLSASASTESHNVFGSEEGNKSRKSLDKSNSSPGSTTPRTLVKRNPAASTSTLTNGATSSTPNLISDNNSPSRIKLKSNQTIIGSSTRAGNSTSSLGISSGKVWESEMESNLKKIYDAIKSNPVFQPLANPSSLSLNETLGRNSISSNAPSASNNSNSPYGTWNGMNRSTSRKSAASSMSNASISGGGGIKRASVRGFGSFLSGTSGGGTGSSNIDFGRSTSPSLTSSTSFSDDTRTSTSSAHRTPTIGFANTLSKSINRSQLSPSQFLQPPSSSTTTTSNSYTPTSTSLTEEDLALLGAPWAKEGILNRKHYWEQTNKRSKDKNWMEAFVVISRGEIKMFRFDGGTIRSNGKANTGNGMGGGDWASNAQSVGEISLSHSLSSAMPSPGYNKSRPHVFILTLPSGGTYFFQAGTQDLITEWVLTCNYWSARSSKEPLSGGVSNMEYGWNRVNLSTGEGAGEGEDGEEDDGNSLEAISILTTPSIRSGKSGKSHLSTYSRNGSSSLGQSLGTTSSSTNRTGTGLLSPVNSNDKILIQDWKIPTVPNGISYLTEEEQLNNFKKYFNILKCELLDHKNLKLPMSKLFSNKSLNQAKATSNWTRKSNYLTSELLKYSTYIESLENALRLKTSKNSEKEVEEMLLLADDNCSDDELVGLGLDKKEGGKEEEAEEDLFGPVLVESRGSERFKTVNLIEEEDEDEVEEDEKKDMKGKEEEEGRRPSLTE